MEPMITISVEDYNKLVRSSGDKRVIELLTIIVNNAKIASESAWVNGLSFDSIGMLRDCIKELQSKGRSFDEILEWHKKGLSNKAVEKE